MSDLKPELSKKNENHLSKHRYYELRHFCLQYPEWVKQLSKLEEPLSLEFVERFQKASNLPRPTERLAVVRAVLRENVGLIEKVALETDSDISQWLIYAVTHGVGFDYLKTVMEIPCERDMYYNRYRKFFWLLDKYRT